MAPLISQKTFSKNLYKIKGIRYRIVRIKSDDYFGIEDQWIGHQTFKITDLEKTLIDGLSKPKYCGGFREVLNAFEQSIHKMDLPKIISYAQKISDVTSRRLGWVLSHLKVSEKHLKPLLEKRGSGFSKLDPSSNAKGPWNRKWLLQENL